MKVGDTVKLISNPSVEWMENYLDKRFEIQDFLVDSLKIKMVDTDPEWVWYAAKDNFELDEGEE
tara:strand:- start:598 stop:789 length:192 start_codon:yes stop_codon:yes gene_type:complete